MAAPTITVPTTGTDPKSTTLGDLEAQVDAGLAANHDNIEAHKADTANPHAVTKAQVGLGNVDNTADANKPVSSATQAALDLKAAAADLADVATSGDSDDLTEGATKLLMTAAERAKLAGVATAATANATDAALRDRATHTGAQAIGTVTGLQAALDGKGTAAQGALADTAVQPGDLAAVATSGDSDDLTEGATRLLLTAAERSKLAGVASSATANASDAALRDRATHTGAQAISTVTGLQAALDGKGTAAQGALADTAVQPGDLAAVATSGDSDDLTEGATKLLMTAAERAKLAGVATAATANATDAALRDRATHTGAQAIGTVTGLQAALDSKGTAAQGALADTAVQPGDGDAIAAATIQRPGDFAAAYGAEITGVADATTPYSAGDVATDDDLGAAITLDQATHVAARVPLAVEAGRVYRARWAVKRLTDPADPLNDAVEIGVRWLTSTQAGVAGGSGNRVVETIALEAADGVQRRSATFSVDVAGVDYTLPATARYGRPWARTYGVDHETLIARADLEDVTEAFLAQAAADASVQPGDDLSVLAETADAKIMSAAERSKLAGIEAGADVSPVASVAGKTGAVTLVKGDVGLGNVDNTSDANKPVSSAAQAALDAEAAARSGADTVLGDDLVAEAATRSATDVKLGTALTPPRHRDSYPGDILFPIRDLEGRVLGGVMQDALAALRLRALAAPARHGDEYAFTLHDEAGRVALAVDMSGTVQVPSLGLPVVSTDRAGGYLMTIRDQADRLALGIDRAGRVEIGGQVVGYAATPDRAGPTGFVWTVRDQADRVALAVREDGTVHLSERYVAPATFSAGIPVGNVRQFEGFQVATRIDEYAYDVRMNTGGSAAFIQHPEPAIFLPCYGQSNAGAQGPLSGDLFEGNRFPEIVVSFANTPRMYGDALVTEGAFVDLAPITDAGFTNQYTVNMAAQAWEYASRQRQFATTPGIFAISVHEGGQPVASFTEDEAGHYNWANLMIACRRAKAVCEDYGREIDCPAILYVQGESGPSSGYAAEVQALAADVTAEVQAQLGTSAPPAFLMVQINSVDDGQTMIDVALDQAASHGVGNILVAGPMYQCPLQDSIHISPAGKRILGDMLGDVLRVLRDTGTWTPLMMTSAVRTGAVIDVTYAVPADGIAFDTDFVKAATNHGFSYVDDDGVAAPDILTVEIVASDTVRITLDGTPTGANPKIQYAVYGFATEDGWATGRGVLYSPSRTPSYFYTLGYDVPPTARHYAVRQSIGVS